MFPWGTPTGTFSWVDWQFSTDVTWYRLSRYEVNHFTTWELAPMVLSFSTRSTWSTVSKAFERSEKTAPVKPPLSRLCSMLSVKWARAVTVESLGRKPNWFGVINSFADKNSYSCWCTARCRILLMVGSTVVCYTAVLESSRNAPPINGCWKPNYTPFPWLANYNSAPIFWKVFAPRLRYGNSSNHSFAFIGPLCVNDRIIKIVEWKQAINYGSVVVVESYSKFRR